MAARVSQTGLHGCLMAKVAREMDHANLFGASCHLIEHPRAAVARAVVDENDLRMHAERRERLPHASEECFEDVHLVEHWQHDADERRGARWARRGERIDSACWRLDFGGPTWI